MKQTEIINLTNLLSINSLFNHNKTNMESLIKEAEQITGCKGGLSMLPNYVGCINNSFNLLVLQIRK